MTSSTVLRRPAIQITLCVLVGLWASSAQAFLVAINPGPRAIYLQVGTGTVSGGTFQSGNGTPQDNGAVNVVSVTVPAAALGTGSRTMTSNSAVAISPYDNFRFCSPPAQVYVGGFYRMPGAAGNATLSVSTPAALSNASSDSIAFNSISWTSSGNNDTGTTIPADTFDGVPLQPLLSVATNRWFESCLTFSYANAQPVAAGTFNGRATYTLTAP